MLSLGQGVGIQCTLFIWSCARSNIMSDQAKKKIIIHCDPYPMVHPLSQCKPKSMPLFCDMHTACYVAWTSFLIGRKYSDSHSSTYTLKLTTRKDLTHIVKKHSLTLYPHDFTGLCSHAFQFDLLFLQDLLVTVFENGSLVREYSFDEIRERAELPLVVKRRQEKQS